MSQNNYTPDWDSQLSDYLYADLTPTMPFPKMDRLAIRRAVRRAMQGYARKRALGTRRRTTSSSQAATLASVRSSYRRSNPMSVSLNNLKQIDFWRTVSFTWTMNQNSGFNGFGHYLGFDFALGNVLGYHTGGFQWAMTMPGLSDFTNLFEQYCIKAVKMTLYYSHNTSTTNHPAEPLPLILIGNDYNDASFPETLATMNQRSGVRRVQMGNAPATHWVKPCVQSYTTQTDPSSGTQSQINAAIRQKTWLNVKATQVRHSGVKLYWDTQGRNGVTDMGDFTITFEVCLSFSGWV